MFETMPKVSIIIPIYNAEKYLSKTIESVMAQTYTDWEIVAVDDGSTDKTPEILKDYEKKLPKKLRVITQKNSGVSIARNTAIAAARGEYIAFLDHDDLWLPEKLKKQVKLLDSNKKLGLVYSDSYAIDDKGILKKGTLMSGRLFRLHARMLRGNVFNELFYVNFIPILTTMVRKNVFNKVGMFDPKYKIAEDYDLFLKIAEQYPIDFTETPLAKYRIYGGNVSKNIEVRVKEDLQISEYWLNKKPELKRKSKDKIRLKHARLHGRLIILYLLNYESKKMIKEIKNFAHDLFL